mmetsp:Transcript_39158/g.79050  ORF Transcript_39158/g.79050 Transcript_39158/m.79050 type:complete len:286 (+) Transcript_39158:65-922(+)
MGAWGSRHGTDHLCAAGLGRLRGFASGGRSSSGTPLPRLKHLVLERRHVKQRLLIVGDIHGCLDELQRLLAQEAFSQDRDTLVLVGDLVNKGPNSGGVLRRARELGALCVRGNHDDELLEAWYRTGRYAKGLERYKHDTLTQVTASDIDWVREWPLSISFPWLQLVVVHAGAVPGVPMEQQEFRNLLFMRTLSKNSDGSWQAMEQDAAGSSPWAGQWQGPPHVVFGHDAKRRLQQAPWATGLDTACCYGDRLTGLILDADSLESRRVCSVPAARMYSVPKDGAGG